ncbi:MAG TPA: ATP-grasp domain-containing protein [Natronosporangium sp.]
MQRYAIVVDPLGTGQEYPAAFREAGVETVAVLTSPEPIPLYRSSWHPENFQHIHVFDGDLAGLASTLRDYRPICLIAGSETGVELADALVERVVPGTGHVPELAAARRDKWAMAQALQRAGIPHLRQICSDDPAEIDQWLRDTGLDTGRVVVKPPKSAATDNVHIVDQGKDWRPLFDQIYGLVNEFGLRNDAVLVQEYADGPEFLIDSYSVDGTHGLVDVCRYKKVRKGDRVGIYDLVDFIEPDHPDTLTVWPYAQRVLDAVGIRNGCCHTEAILTRNGPRLLEVGARPAGGGHQMISKLATGDNHILRTVAHRVRGEFKESYQLVQHVCSVVITAPHAGRWRNQEIFADVSSLPTYWAEHFYFHTGDQVPAPAGLSSMLGWVVLASKDRDAMMADYRRIKDLERQIDVEP